MINTESSSHLTCFIEAIAIAKHTTCTSCEDLVQQLQEKGYEDIVTVDTVNELRSQLTWVTQ
ncbi:hypothetical protein KUL152_34020 [Tenacibaculum sp. KUL152]|nr:hypothetical protein KUL152_34020 [Tenacibaculum sp. KUL152]